MEPLKVIWRASEQLCSKRLKAALPLWLPFYEQEHGTLEDALIVHEASERCSIASKNKKHLATICETFGKTLLAIEYEAPGA